MANGYGVFKDCFKRLAYYSSRPEALTGPMQKENITSHKLKQDWPTNREE
jgi:hypothetical protein